MTHVAQPPGKLQSKLPVFLAEQFMEDRKRRGTAWESDYSHAIRTQGSRDTQSARDQMRRAGEAIALQL